MSTIANSFVSILRAPSQETLGKMEPVKFDAATPFQNPNAQGALANHDQFLKAAYESGQQFRQIVQNIANGR